ncbi:hypothetical protein ONZ45_g15433 [Pleurotus djamor]|nr:hypothetical protein ONZ45_g15433 [Pleurotus djamor]
MSDSPPEASSSNSHLSFPTFEQSPAEPTKAPTPQSRLLLQDRLYIGNLHPTVDEYSLLQVFSKFGKVTKLDFLFHKTGALKGKPRGYAFVEYGSKAEAAKAQSLANDKLLRGRKLVVTFAQQAPLDQSGQPIANHPRRGMMDVGKPTTLSLLKSSNSRNAGTNNKIAMMEAKLREIAATKPGAQSTSTLPSHPSLPPKPAFAAASLPSDNHTGERSRSKPSTPLPSLPIAPKSTSTPPTPSIVVPKSTQSSSKPAERKSLLGVKIIKKPKP